MGSEYFSANFSEKKVTSSKLILGVTWLVELLCLLYNLWEILFSCSNFCIIEGPETVQDFVQMQMQEIQDNIRSRRNKIFLLMEEVSFVITVNIWCIYSLHCLLPFSGWMTFEFMVNLGAETKNTAAFKGLES